MKRGPSHFSISFQLDVINVVDWISEVDAHDPCCCFKIQIMIIFGWFVILAAIALMTSLMSTSKDFFSSSTLPRQLLFVSYSCCLYIPSFIAMKFLGYIAGVVAMRSFSAVAFTSIDNRPRLSLEGPQIVEDVQHSHSSYGSRRGQLLNAQSRRDILIAGGGMMTSSLLFVPKASGLEFAPPSASLPSGLLDSRVQGNVLAPPPYGMEGPDIFYPE